MNNKELLEVVRKTEIGLRMMHDSLYHCDHCYDEKGKGICDWFDKESEQEHAACNCYDPE